MIASAGRAVIHLSAARGRRRRRITRWPVVLLLCTATRCPVQPSTGLRQGVGTVPLSPNDVSDYVASPGERPVRLVVEFGALRGTPPHYPVGARLDDGRTPPLRGRFVVDPEWRPGGPSARPALSKGAGRDTFGRPSVGTQLFTALFSGGLSRSWAQAVEQARTTGALHVVVRSSDPAVQALPWEQLTDPTAPTGPITLTEGWSVVRDVGGQDRPPLPPRAPVDVGDLDVLVLTTPAAGVPQENDAAIVRGAFPAAHVTVLQDVRRAGLLDAVRRERHLVHVLAAAAKGVQGAPTLLLDLADGAQSVTAATLADALCARGTPPRLVVLAACDSDLVAAELARRVPNVIGIRGAISDEGCRAFLRGLYGALASGSTLDRAVASGRAQQLGFSQSLNQEWALPVLFLGDATAPVHLPQADPPAETARETLDVPAGAAREHADRLRREMRQLNLQDLHARWDASGPDLPAFVSRTIDALEHADPPDAGAGAAAVPRWSSLPRAGGAGGHDRARATVAGLASAVEGLIERLAVRDAVRDLVAAMEPARLVPLAGEQELLGALGLLLRRGRQLVAETAHGSAAVNATHLAELEALLALPEWLVASETRDDLTKRSSDLELQVRTLKEDRGTRRLAFQRLHAAIERATAAGLEITEQDAELDRVDGRFRTSDADFAAGRYDTTAVALEHAQERLAAYGLTDPEAFEAYIGDLERRTAEQEEADLKKSRRTELFLISGTEVDKDVPYKVMLRRPGHRERQETNLYDDVAVQVTDQDLFRDVVDRIAANATAGVRSDAARLAGRRPEEDATPDEDTTPDEGVEVRPAGVDADGPALRRARPRRADVPAHLEQLGPDRQLERVGRLMYSLLIPDAMQRLIDETPGFPLTVTSNNPELPWELMHDGDQFLCLKRMFARMPAGQTFPRRNRVGAPAPSGRRTKALLIESARAGDLPQAREEIQEVEDALRAMSPQQVEVVSVPPEEVTSSRLTDEFSLGSYDLIHYAGHAGFDPERPQLSYLLLPNGERFRAERVQRLLEGRPVVFLNACESSRAQPDVPGRTTGGIVAQSQGLAAAFVYGGAQACVGSLWPVFDDTARAFARTFYWQLITRRQRVGEALREARLAARASAHDSITWAAYALYGDPSYRLGQDPVGTWGERR